MAERLDDGNLRDRVEIPAFVQDQIHVGEWLQSPSESTLGLSNPFCDGPDLSVVRTQQDHNPIGIPKGVAAEDYCLVVSNGHGHRVFGFPRSVVPIGPIVA